MLTKIVITITKKTILYIWYNRKDYLKEKKAIMEKIEKQKPIKHVERIQKIDYINLILYSININNFKYK